MSTLLTRNEVAELLQVSKSTVRRWEVECKLRPIRLSPRVIRFHRQDVEKLVSTTA